MVKNSKYICANCGKNRVGDWMFGGYYNCVKCQKKEDNIIE